jgi:hypothetical protein
VHQFAAQGHALLLPKPTKMGGEINSEVLFLFTFIFTRNFFNFELE